MLLAQDLDTIQSQGLPGNTIPTDIGGLIGDVLPYIFGAAGIALLIYLIMGGLQMMTSQGDPKAMQGAQAKITNGLTGFAIIFVSFWVMQIIGKILGINMFSNIFK